MSLFASPEEHAANPPASWLVVKVAPRCWSVTTADGDVLDTFATRADALAVRGFGSVLANLYAAEGRWYAGVPRAGHRSYADCKAESDRIAARWAATPADDWTAKYTGPFDVFAPVA